MFGSTIRAPVLGRGREPLFPAKRPIIVVRDGAGDVDNSVKRRVLDDVERHVPEVPLIPDPVPRTDAGLAVAFYIPREPEARPEIVPVRVPQLPYRAVGCRQDITGRDVFRQVGIRKIHARSVPVRIEVCVLVVLDSEVLPPNAEIQRECGAQLPGILSDTAQTRGSGCYG